jgi:UDP-GlcNAc:undecaprenyl-phosphate GlcNAc-1-phosphate transferase
VLIYGAGDAAGLVIREVLAKGVDVRILGFIDDDPRKAGNRVMGYPVLGGYSALAVLLNASSVDAVVVSTLRLPPERLNNLRVACADYQVELTRLSVGFESLVSSDRSEAEVAPPNNIRQIRS